MVKVCPNCGKEFHTDNYGKVYCCTKCGAQYRAKGGRISYPVGTFTCAYCGRAVTTEGGKDKRTRFCCADCEKRYWKHPPESKPSTIRNFHSAQQYAGYEKWSNENINTGRD